MGSLTKANFLTYVDKINTFYTGTLGTSGSGYGTGNADPTLASDWGGSKAARQWEDLIIATGDGDEIAALQGCARDLEAIARIFPDRMRKTILGLSRRCQKVGLTGVGNLDQYCTYYNLGAGVVSSTYWTCMLPPEWYTIYYFQSIARPQAWNIYAAPITNIAQQVVGGSFTGGTAVDGTKYAGAVVSKLTVTGFSGSTVTVVVTGSARSSSGAIVASGRTFSVSVTGNGTFTLVPAVTGDILISVASISIPGGMSAGAVVVGGFAPAGRTYPTN